MNILLTGGAGFMGSNMVHYLLRQYPEYKVLNFDKLTYAGNPANVKNIEKNPNYTFMQGDIADEEGVNKAFEEFKPDVVINYAAETHVDRSILDPKAFLMTDIIGTYTLLEAMRKYGTKKMVQISTDEVFGSIEEGAFTETSPFEPNSPYSASKAGGDHLCRAYWVTFETPVVVTHSCNFYGPNQYPEKLIPLFITNLIEGKKVPVYAKGENVREWIFTEDHCRAVDRILHDGKPGDVYNIGTGKELTNMEITNMILKALGVGEEMIEYVKDRPGHDFRYAIDCSKLTNDLGWKPSVEFEEGLQQTIDWYKNNEDWWKPLKSGEYMEYYKKQYQDR
ncbi:MAG: dTDP-glucose 4,6-dehydratase [Candidatus Kerfeldbacteria bacterium]